MRGSDDGVDRRGRVRDIGAAFGGRNDPVGGRHQADRGPKAKPDLDESRHQEEAQDRVGEPGHAPGGLSAVRMQCVHTREMQ